MDSDLPSLWSVVAPPRPLDQGGVPVRVGVGLRPRHHLAALVVDLDEDRVLPRLLVAGGPDRAVDAQRVCAGPGRPRDGDRVEAVETMCPRTSPPTSTASPFTSPSMEAPASIVSSPFTFTLPLN